jgi:hypothetical protein
MWATFLFGYPWGIIESFEPIFLLHVDEIQRKKQGW